MSWSWVELGTYSGRDAWKEYHWACTRPPRVSHLLQHSNLSDSPAFCASPSQLLLPQPDQITFVSREKKNGKNNQIYLLSNKMTDPAFILMKNYGPITQVLISCFPFHFLTNQTRQDTKSPGPTLTLSGFFTFSATKQKKKKYLILTTNCWASGQDCLAKRLTATKRLLLSFPL